MTTATILKNTISLIQTYNKNDKQQLKDRKVINELKVKRNRSKLKAKYQELINTLEKEYNLKYGA